MHLLILPTGRTRKKEILALEAEYARRLPTPWSYEVRELKASTATNPEQSSREESTTQLAVLKGLPPGSASIALDETGKQLTSHQWAENLRTWQTGGIRHLAFFIGGAAGFQPEVIQACTTTWSLSKLTLPHQLVRPLLAEQLYRSFTLLTGHPYHRD